MTANQDHWAEFHRELPGVQSGWAPYQVRRIGDDTFSVFSGGHRVATARLDGGLHHVVDIEVLPEHRRRGIASALYAHIESVLGYPLEPSPTYQTPDGQGLWSSRPSR